MSGLPDPTWNATDVEYPDDLFIHELFERQVAKTPHAMALIDGERAYTYEDINARANQLARALQEQGVRPQSVVGCYLTQHSAVVLYTLAIMKAGGTYVLLDANMPALRIKYIIDDVRPVIVLTDAPLPQIAAKFTLNFVSVADLTLDFIGVGQLEEESRDQDSHNLAVSGDNTNAAYISYTSGSTGFPKGVIITHKATVNHACAFSNEFDLGPSDRVPLMTPVSFDTAIEEMIPPLIAGCTLIASRSDFESMRAFNQEILENGYTMVNIAAPLWHEWVAYLSAQAQRVPPSLRIVIAGSDKILTSSLEQWKRLEGASTVRWVAAYGTTETTITSTLYTSGTSDDLRDEPYVPIGKPIANTYIYLLDENLKPVRTGKEGVLYIGGQGLARGYYHHPELTERSFVPNPFRNEPGAKMYNTGDLARFRPDGNIVWLGRTDWQIKLYGLRIEPGEVEAVLNKSESLDESVVILRQTGEREADKQIVAFVTTKPGQEFNERELRALAQAHLPRLMVPQKYVHLAALPLNTNGKLDRKALEHSDL
jgi:amino acid adenylation domain-containing protein